MPKRMIVYASRGGATKECAERLAALLGDCELYDAELGTPYVVDVDTVIIGSYIHMGTVNSGVKRFIVQNGKELPDEKINVGLFICSAVLEQADDVIEANFPRFLLEKACAISSFGGRLGSENLSGMDRLIAKKFEKLYRKNGGQPPVILDRVIERFADEILRAEAGESSSIDTIPESAE